VFNVILLTCVIMCHFTLFEFMSSEHMHEVYVILILQNIRVIHSIEAAYLCFVSGMFSLLHYFLVYHPSFPCLL